MTSFHLPRPILYILLTLAAFLVVAAITLGGVAYAYKGKFYPGIKVGGMNLSGKTYAEGEQIVKDRVAQYRQHQVVLTVPKISEAIDADTGTYPDLEIKTTSAELGLAFKEQEALDAAWAVGHQHNLVEWAKTGLGSIFSGSRHPLQYTVDQKSVATFINTQVGPQVITPTPAKLVVEKTTISVTDQKPGLTIDQNVLARLLSESMASATDNDTTYIKAPSEVVDSPVTKATIQPIAEQLDRLANLKVSLTSDQITLNPGREQLLAWFGPVQDDQGKFAVVLNKEAVSSYLNKNGKNKVKVSESVNAVVAALGTVTDPDTSADQLKQSYSVTLAVKPPEAVTPGNYNLNLGEGKYVQVNLSEQKMYLINNHVLEKTFTVSSGKWSTPTPKGEFYIAGKHPRAYSKTYGLYMPYWQNIMNDNVNLGEYGLHELPEWPNGYKEGQSHLGTPVSHGCVRLGVGDAKEVYDWTEIGTKVFIN